MMNIITYLEESVKRNPEKIAFSDENNTITYLELYEKAGHIASFIAENIESVNKPIMVLVNRSIESIIAMLGIAMSRNFYVPVDSEQPLLRIKAILSQTRPELIIYFNDLPEELKEEGLPLISYDEMDCYRVNREKLDSLKDEYLDEDPLYAICTSGSTGTPKVVVKSNGSITSFIPVFAETFKMTGEDVFGNQAPFDFDVSAKDIYSTLYLGASCYIIPKSSFILVKKLMDELEEKGITTLTWSVSALCIIAGMNAFKYKVPQHIKRVLFSGEVMPIKMLNIWRKNYPEAEFVNLFGPTEVTGNSLYYIVDREFEDREKLPLGKPFKNTRVLFLNEEGRKIGPGEEGEICIMSPCLAIGYYGDPERTEKVFVKAPDDFTHQRMYLTGDIAYMTEGGEYYFSARKDNQIKHMGHRIELEEIERFINAAPGVTRSCCLFDDRKNKIVCYYAGDVDKVDIIGELKNNLPKYMIPNIFMKVESLPINKNGKIDRQGIRRMYEGIGNE